MKNSFQNLYKASMLGSQFHVTALQHEQTVWSMARVEFLNEFVKLVILILLLNLWKQ